MHSRCCISPAIFGRLDRIWTFWVFELGDIRARPIALSPAHTQTKHIARHFIETEIMHPVPIRAHSPCFKRIELLGPVSARTVQYPLTLDQNNFASLVVASLMNIPNLFAAPASVFCLLGATV